MGSFSAATDVIGADQQRDERPRVLFLNRSYWPDVEATGQLLSSLCEGLSERFRIEVLAGQPNAIIGSADSAELSEAAKWREVIEHQGVRIHRLSHTVLPKKNLLYMSLNFVSFIRSANAALRRMSAPDVVVFETESACLHFLRDDFSA